MMKKYIYIILLVFSSIVLLGSCSDDNDDAKQVDVESIKVTNQGAEDAILLVKGNNLQLEVVTKPENQQVNYYTSNANVVKVNKDGFLEPIDVGSAHIIINAPNGEGFTQTKCVINVVTYVEEIIMPLGNDYQILPIDAVLDINGYFEAKPSNAANTNLKFKSSNPQLASVDDLGIVTAHGKGEVKISAYVDGGSTVESGTILFYAGYEHKLFDMTTWTATASSTHLSSTYKPENVFNTTLNKTWMPLKADTDRWLLIDMKEVKVFHNIYVSRYSSIPSLTKFALYLSENNVDGLAYDDPSFVKLNDFQIPYGGQLHSVTHNSFPGATKKARYVRVSIVEWLPTTAFMSINIFNAGVIE